MVDYDLRRLRILSELETRGTIHAVSTALNYSPSAVSQQLAVLEKEVGARLLEKAGRSVRLTDAGCVLAHHARLLLNGAEAAAADLAALTGEVRGTVRAGGLQSAVRRLLIPAAAQMMGGLPQVRLEIFELELEQALPDLRLGAVDLVISDEYDGQARPRPSGLRFEVFYEEPLRLVLPASHPLAQRGPVALVGLRDDVWVTSDEGTGHHAMVLGTCRSLGGYEPDVRHRSGDADIQLEMVRSIGAIALLPVLTLPSADAAIAVRDIAETPVRRRLLVVTRETPATPALATFLAVVIDHAQRLHLATST